MSMKMLTILQFISALSVYSLMTVLLPALIFHRKFHRERLPVRFFFYLTIGNFYLMNLVFLLQLLHISNRVTLILGTVFPAVAAAVKVNHISVKNLAVNTVNHIFKLSRGTLGMRLLMKRGSSRISMTVSGFGKRLLRSLRSAFLEWILLIGFIVFLLWVYGTNMLDSYGFFMSDVPVHHYWINYMGKNQIFIAGVYPFGFHCIIYYLHTVFGIETFVLLRVFGLIQTLYIHLVLLAFLKTFLKTRYIAYAAVFAYAGASFYNIYTYQRYYSPLPQEFGMIFILPSICFLFAFLNDRKLEVDKEKEEDETAKKEDKKPTQKISIRIGEIRAGIQRKTKEHSTIYLVGFAMCFSMTMAVHFYNTMIAGLFCIGVAAGYAVRLFRRQYFARIMQAGILSIIFAVLPMGIAFAMGTPLQGSLGWGMEVISGERDQEEEPPPEQKEETATEAEKETALNTEAGYDDIAGSTQAEPPNITFGERLNRLGLFLGDVGNAVWIRFEEYVMPDASHSFRMIVAAMSAGLLVLGVLFLLAKKRDYGATLLSTACFMFFMIILFASKELSIPELMDKNRSSIYLAYMLTVAFGFFADGILWGILGQISRKIIMNGVSLLMTGGLIGAIIMSGQIKHPIILTPLESNAAIICLTNILRDNEDWTYTICSSNDELRMMEEYGYHFETIEFLKKMEKEKTDGKENEEMLILPTEHVYFFVEKQPIDYDLAYEDSGQNVSHEGAAQPLPQGKGLSVYQARNRWIVMSKMYYWAETFQDLYQNEMRVYYETDDFICYEVTQNPYRLYDFSIDYGYNTTDR